MSRLPSWARAVVELAADALEALFDAAFYGGADVPWWVRR